MHSQLALFNDTIKKMEKENSAVHSALYLSTLQEKLLERKTALFMGLKVKNIVMNFQERHQVEVFRQGVLSFYDCCISYLQEWGSTFCEVKCLSGTLLEHIPEWDEVESSLRYVSSKLPQTDINETELFDEVTSVKTYTSEKIEEWNTALVPADERWTEMFTHFNQGYIPYKNISIICQFALVPSWHKRPCRAHFLYYEQYMD